MPFIGIIAEERKSNIIKKQIVEQLKIDENLIILIKEKNIENIKNIKFDTIILDRKFNNEKNLKMVLENVKYLIINCDVVKSFNVLNDIEINVITYGFNSKATITASSVGEEEILVCLQRNKINAKKQKVEPQEVKIEIQNDAMCTMAITAILLIYGKII